MGGIDLVNIKTFDLNLLRALHALLENCNVSAAARQLNLSQPATSAALSRLRHALGDVLLVRDGNRMSLSPRAERLLPRVGLVMTEIELALRDDLFDPTTSERTFRIAATDDAIEIIVTPLIERLRIAAPASSWTSLELQRMSPAIWPPARSISPSPPAGIYATPAIESRF
jgi:DNA-binding transcriptional LysR family regulator